MSIRIIGKITRVETIAVGWKIREFARLVRTHGFGRWRKRKGIAQVMIESGHVFTAEIHWYEASGRGRQEFKIKRILDE